MRARAPSPFPEPAFLLWNFSAANCEYVVTIEFRRVPVTHSFEQRDRLGLPAWQPSRRLESSRSSVLRKLSGSG